QTTPQVKQNKARKSIIFPRNTAYAGTSLISESSERNHPIGGDSPDVHGAVVPAGGGVGTGSGDVGQIHVYRRTNAGACHCSGREADAEDGHGRWNRIAAYVGHNLGHNERAETDHLLIDQQRVGAGDLAILIDVAVEKAGKLKD